MPLTSRRVAMPRKRFKPEEIVAKLRQGDVLVSQGQKMAEGIRQIGVGEVTYSVPADSLKALDLDRPIREADIPRRLLFDRFEGDCVAKVQNCRVMIFWL